MGFLQKIYINDKPLILTTDKAAYINDNPGAQKYSFFAGETLQTFKEALHHLERTEAKGAVVENISATLPALLHTIYRSIDAGGGVAYNEDGDILMIYRRGKWDLPKGKLDDNENIEECALREVREETGLEHLSLAAKICDTYHVYAQNNEQVLKRTAWYKMKGTAADKLLPQKEENILEARWVNEKDLAPLVARTYEAIREVLTTAGLKW